jgi:glycosyltransferase involved in cell wall biosynthesis
MINLVCPINSTGYGLTALNILLSLEKVGANPTLFLIGNAEAPVETHPVIKEAMMRTRSYDHRAPSLRIFHQFDLALHAGTPRCSMPIFELTKFLPNEVHHLASQDIIFANSAWAANILMEAGIPEDRLRFAPLAIDRSIFVPTTEMSCEGPTTFLNVGKWEVRKGHDVLLECFEKAFTQDDDVRLIMACFNPCLKPQYSEDWCSVYRKSKLAGKIELCTKRFDSQKEIYELMKISHCGVFPSRAEGWGLDSAEMLSVGRHVILTDYSGHTAYATKENSRLISIDSLTPANDGIWFHSENPDWGNSPGLWADIKESQKEQIISHMREVHRLRMEGSLQPNLAGIETMKHFTWERVAEQIMKSISH